MSQQQLQVFQVAPAAPRLALWLHRVLSEVIAASRFESVPAVELRRTEPWRGWSDPAGYVCVSSRAVFWRPVEIVDVVLHEWAHALTQRIVGAHAGHDAAFFCINYSLRLRADAAGASPSRSYSIASLVSLYDLAELPESLHDDPDRGVGRCVTWAVTLAAELSPSDLTAEALAREVVERYQAWLVELEDRPRLQLLEAEQADRQSGRQAAMVERLEDRLFVSNLVALLSLSFLSLMAVMLWHR